MAGGPRQCFPPSLQFIEPRGQDPLLFIFDWSGAGLIPTEVAAEPRRAPIISALGMLLLNMPDAVSFFLQEICILDDCFW